MSSSSSSSFTLVLWCCERRCFQRSRTVVDGMACDSCKHYGYCVCRCITYQPRYCCEKRCVLWRPRACLFCQPAPIEQQMVNVEWSTSNGQIVEKPEPSLLCLCECESYSGIWSIDRLFRRYADVNARLATFPDNYQDARPLALAGFAYDPRYRAPRCWFCLKKLPVALFENKQIYAPENFVDLHIIQLGSCSATLDYMERHPKFVYGLYYGPNGVRERRTILLDTHGQTASSSRAPSSPHPPALVSDEDVAAVIVEV